MKKRKQEKLYNTQLKILSGARQLLIDKGWCQGDLTKHGRVCAQEAIYIAMLDSNSATKAMLASGELLVGLEKEVKFVSGCVPFWNDDEHNTKTKVLRAFDNAISLVSGELACL